MLLAIKNTHSHSRWSHSLVSVASTDTDEDGRSALLNPAVVRRVHNRWRVCMMRDIRELVGQPEAYAAELNRRWGGLMSYRYIGRRFGVIDDGPVEETVTIRRDMRNPSGGLLLAVLSIASPEGGNITDLEAVP